MDQKRADELQKEINKETDPAKKLAMLEAAIHEAMDDGATTLPFAQVEALCEFATKAVKVAFAEVLQVAKDMRSDTVPVKFLEYVMHEQPTAVQALMATIDRFGIDLSYAGTPDDISELEGL